MMREMKAMERLCKTTIDKLEYYLDKGPSADKRTQQGFYRVVKKLEWMVKEEIIANHLGELNLLQEEISIHINTLETIMEIAKYACYKATQENINGKESIHIKEKINPGTIQSTFN